MNKLVINLDNYPLFELALELIRSKFNFTESLTNIGGGKDVYLIPSIKKKYYIYISYFLSIHIKIFLNTRIDVGEWFKEFKILNF